MARPGSRCRYLMEAAGPGSWPGGGSDTANASQAETAVRSALDRERRRLTPAHWPVPAAWAAAAAIRASPGRAGTPAQRGADLAGSRLTVNVVHDTVNTVARN